MDSLNNFEYSENKNSKTVNHSSKNYFLNQFSKRVIRLWVAKHENFELFISRNQNFFFLRWIKNKENRIEKKKFSKQEWTGKKNVSKNN